MAPISASVTDRPVVLELTLLGLLSAACSICFAALGDVSLPGFFFGGAIAIYLSKLKTLSERDGFRLLGVAIFAQIAAVQVAFRVQPHFEVLQTAAWSNSHGEVIAQFTFAVAGSVGAFLVLGEALYLLGGKVRIGPFLIKLVVLSVWGGVLAVIGWALGPYLGLAVAHVFSLLHSRFIEQSPNGSLLGHEMPVVEYSLYPIWQMGAAFAIGLMVRRTDSAEAAALARSED
jgi:hypothetical protein